MPAKRRRAVRRPDGQFRSSLSTFIGTSLIARLTDASPDHAPLRIGSDVWSTHQLATELGVVNTRAARLLSRAAESINAKNLRDLYARSTPYTFALHGVGETTLYVLWRLFESQGYDPDRWATAGDTKAALTSFHSLKQREQEAERRTLAAAKPAARVRRTTSDAAAIH